MSISDNKTYKFTDNILNVHKQALLDHGFSFDENNIATIPTGFVLIENSRDVRYVECKNTEGDLVFTMFVKETLYDNFSYLNWVSEEESNRIKNEEENAENIHSIVQNEIATIMETKWSEQTMYIVYYYRNGESRARQFAGSRCTDDMIIEFSKHKIIGFISDINKFEQFENIVRKYPKYFEERSYDERVVVRKLPNGLNNLHRFERSHLFDEQCDYYTYRQQKTLFIGTMKSIEDILQQKN